ncbi:MAG TPA: hypothetical protein VLR26_04140 [Frankiaceae bacterium]|nr:hypothetical protein [Frankiaceae bacterium]
MTDYPEDELWFSDVIPDPEDDENIPPDRPVALEDYGITAEEERTPEPLSRFVTREVPEARVGQERADEDSDENPEETAARTVISELFGQRRPH